MPTIPPIPTPPDPTPTPGDTRPYWKRFLAQYLPWLIALGMTYLMGWLNSPTKVERVEVPVPPTWLGEPGQPFVGVEDGSKRPTYGWVKDPQVIEANLNPAITGQFADTPAGKAVMGDDDVFLWQAVRKVNNRGPPWYPAVDQKDVGCCVGCGWKHAADICQAMQIVGGTRAEWKPLSVEVIYGGSRVEIGRGQIRGDGSVGAWAAKWVGQYGVAPMEKFGSVDLSTFSPARAREFGRTGVPADIEDAAKLHPVKAAALVKSWADVKRAIQQGYPVAVCSDQGFSMTRDRDGFARASGSWAHCMCICGVRKGPREGGFILNSWGDTAHTGPVWPADAPVAGFWADAAVIDRMVRQGDSFALADLQGFPARPVPLDWGFGRAEPARPALTPKVLFARFAPEGAVLAW